MKMLIALVCVSVAVFCPAQERPLPGEPAQKPAVCFDPFPSRLYAFVFRNWTCVPVQRLAETIGTEPEKLIALAADLGLAPQGKLEPEWRTKGYITVLRRNWHLLPYPQLLTLLGKSREELRYCLMEDDFLMVKLGNIKPKVEPLAYAEPTAHEREQARHLAALLAQEHFPVIQEEPRFSFIPPLSAVSSKLASQATSESGSPFSFRLIFSYFADYGDPLGDPAIASYPEGLLQRLASHGVNAVWLHTVLNTLAKDPAYPEFGEGCENRMTNLRMLVARAKKYGIRVFLYMNEPRSQEAIFFTKNGRESQKGVQEGHRNAMCTSAPEVREWMRRAVASVFRSAPGLGGIFTITASENLTSCASHNHQDQCPRCKARPYADVIAEVNATLSAGMLEGADTWKEEGAYRPQLLAWDWGWKAEEVRNIIGKLPKTARYMTVSERGLPIDRGGVKSTVAEYSISSVGPSEQSRQRWRWAKEAGLSTIAKVQAGVTWELSSFPYIPALELVAEHAANLAKSEVDGVMLSWSLGCYPSPNLEVFQRYRAGANGIDTALNQIAAVTYGEDAVPAVREAWRAFSKGFREFPFHIGSVYDGPQQMGPANPLYCKPTGWHATMVGIPYDDLGSWKSIYPAEVWISQLEKVAHGFEEGCKAFERACVNSPIRQRELRLFQAEQLHFLSSANQSRFILTRDAYLKAAGEEKAKLARELVACIRTERESARKLLPICQQDSRVGYECSNHYFYIPQDLREKILLCSWMLEQIKE
ncbi:MAG: hypothetical protein IKR48_06925 [Kiritimatiellae bacterium]|nr:hypothetical protein [Kiritimatiellia bacterium]